ncbi:Hua1 protein [Starmerella bacillaris]|uniref:Hua1 protein n=1 Tax=Starmerella bacillaris TaxID=1247836 RepID=A0AAV5RIP6_STABA|nr:Hua1 protein [Starmerella bacillaris]
MATAYEYNDTVPTDEPPPYSEIAESGSVSLDQGANVPRRSQRPSQPPPSRRPSSRPPSSRPPSSRPDAPPPSRSSRSHSGQQFAPPPGPPPSKTKQRPPSRTYYEMLDDPLRPSNGPPSGHNGYASQGPPRQGQRRPPGGPPGPPGGPPGGARPNQYNQRSLHLRYPPNFRCPKCNNTGVKINGRSCKSCYRDFGVPNAVQTIPNNFAPVFRTPPRVLPPGHPGIGGRLCGQCRGSGVISELFLFQSTCPMCRGVGRVF